MAWALASGQHPRRRGPSLPVEPGDGPARSQLAPSVVGRHPGGSPPGNPPRDRGPSRRGLDGGEAAGHGASGSEAEHAGVAADLPESGGGPLPEVLDGSLAFLVGLRAADRESGRRSSEHGVPHDRVHGYPAPGRLGAIPSVRWDPRGDAASAIASVSRVRGAGRRRSWGRNRYGNPGPGSFERWEATCSNGSLGSRGPRLAARRPTEGGFRASPLRCERGEPSTPRAGGPGPGRCPLCVNIGQEHQIARGASPTTPWR